MVEESHHENRGVTAVNNSTSLARVVVRQIIEAGITDVVISPGSRNAPLSLAFFEASQEGLIKIHVRVDERTAAFFALGIIKSTGRPVPVVCTSGTAVANYHPAILEASHTNAPLMVLTADRPAMLRKTGANQTTEQARIFGKAVRYFADIDGPVYPMELPLDSLRNGPIHLNLQFDEPLLSDDSSDWLSQINVAPKEFVARTKPGTLRLVGARGVVVIGHDRGGLTVDEISRFTKVLGWPVITEDPLSFPDAIAHASIFLASPEIRSTLIPQSVLVIGRTTLSRSINAFIKSSPITYVVDQRLATVDSDRQADRKFTELPDLQGVIQSDEWIAKWNKVCERAQKLIGSMSGWNEAVIARTIAATIPDGTALFVSSSRPIRDLEGFAYPRTGVHTYANRGLAGIDGNISTALGVAFGHKATIALLGDLSFLHDLTGLINKEEINCRFIVINNDGGGIFSTLPQRGVNGFETVFGTPHGLNPAVIAQAMGVQAKQITSLKELEAEVKAPISGVSVVVCDVPDRESNADTLKRVVEDLSSI
jgi:2-succinyl-5-enolpyruvyl-6-hydroxy-3-cyclohexene-1-carboxylate synthase